MKNLCSLAAVLIALFLIVWLALGLFGVVGAIDDRAIVLALVGILCALVNPPTLPKV